jgi:hypothetical protein
MTIALTINNGKCLNNWLTGKVSQCLVDTVEYGKVFIFHGSPYYQENLNTISQECVKHILKDKNIKILTCHSLCYPEWVQKRCLILTQDPVTIMWYGGSTYFAK